ncbi:MAG: acetoacetate decarboxylase family protein [Candidatus Binataceae bacterium]
MNDKTGFGDITESGQMIPVGFRGENGIYVHSMDPDDDAPIVGGREIWGVPRKLARPNRCHESEVLAGTPHFGSVLHGAGGMGYKRKELDTGPVPRELACPNFLIKIVSHADGGPRICERCVIAGKLAG